MTEASVFEVDVGAVEHNARQLQRLLGPSCALYAALKCDAYGFGLLPVAARLQQAGVTAFAVSRLCDAIALRENGVSISILLYGGSPVTREYAAAVEHYDLMPTVLDRDTALVLSNGLERERPVFVKVDVGQRRLGAEPRMLTALATAVARIPRLRLEGIYTHLTVPPDPVPPGHIERQHELFLECLAEVNKTGVEVPIRMAASSSVLRLAGGLDLDAVDPGLIYFGLTQSGPATTQYQFRSAFLSLKTQLIQVKQLDDDPRRPDPPFSIQTGARIGIVPLGIADGLGVASAAEVLVHGQRAPLIEPIALEHCRIDLTRLSQAASGDEVVVVGRQGGEQIALGEVAGRRGLIGNEYQIPVSLRSSIPRSYLN